MVIDSREPDMSPYTRAGAAAFHRGMPISACPYRHRTEQSVRWRKGYVTAREQAFDRALAELPQNFSVVRAGSRQ